MTASSFFRRPLPSPPLFAFSSHEGRALFVAAMLAGHMEAYFPLSENFRTQDDPAFCGLSTLVMSLNSMRVDPGRAWKGPWRFYHEAMLDCCEPLEVVRDRGITLPSFACLARCNGADAELRFASEWREEDFRAAVWRATAEADVETEGVLVCSYDRKVLGQTGSGHFSPVGGYEPEQDMVLVMDVARFKYPPYWVSVAVLFAAMATKDPATEKSRGWIALRPSRVDPLLLTLKRSSHFEWPGLVAWWAGFKDDVRAGLLEGATGCGPSTEDGCCDTDRAMQRLVETLPANLLGSVLSTLGREHGAGALEKVWSKVEALVRGIEATTTYRVLRRRSGEDDLPLGQPSGPVELSHLTTLVLLASLDDEVILNFCSGGPCHPGCKLAPLLRDISAADALLREEIASTRRMLDNLDGIVNRKDCSRGGNANGIETHPIPE